MAYRGHRLGPEAEEGIDGEIYDLDGSIGTSQWSLKSMAAHTMELMRCLKNNIWIEHAL